MHLNRLPCKKNLLATIYLINFSRDTKRKASLTFSLVTTFIIISSLSFLINIDTMENINAEIVNKDIIRDVFDPSLGLKLVEGGGVIVVPDGTTATTPTFNPMFSECDQGEDTNLYKWEVAKYAITARIDDKDKLKGNDFSLDIFADIMNDDAYFDSKDYPYKADIKTEDNKETKINIKEFMTLCADIVDLGVAKATQVDLGKSEALKELGFDN